jgi:hypothetical protein
VTGDRACLHDVKALLEQPAGGFMPLIVKTKID